MRADWGEESNHKPLAVHDRMLMDGFSAKGSAWSSSTLRCAPGIAFRSSPENDGSSKRWRIHVCEDLLVKNERMAGYFPREACSVVRMLMLAALAVTSACDTVAPAHPSPAQEIQLGTGDKRQLEEALRAPKDLTAADSAQLAAIG